MSHAWSQEAPADIVTVVEAIIAASDATDTVVFDGRAKPGVDPPFVTVWQLDPQPVAMALAAEDWGQSHGQWQISPHGVTQGQARYLLEQITDYAWPVGWELVEVGPLINDTTDKPETWFWPVTFVYRGMA